LIDWLRQVKNKWELAAESRRLSPLYHPSAAQTDRAAHLQAGIDWLRRAQDAGTDRGVSYGVTFGSDWEASYPETTGYICKTFAELGARLSDEDLVRRAWEMGEWEAAIQMPEGAVMGGKLNATPTPAVFNTGMVLLGWGALLRQRRTGSIEQAATRAAEWLVKKQEPDGNWIRGNSKFAASGSTLYNVKAAWGLCEVGVVLGREEWVEAARKNADYCLVRQLGNGWFRECCLADPERPLLHTLAYTMQGLLEIGRLTGERKYIEAARRGVEAELRILRDDGFLPGQQSRDFTGPEWCCLTGSAQVSKVCSTFYEMGGDERYRAAAERINGYLIARHDIENADERLRGGVAGSWPVDGPYGRLKILNWATKYLVDALAAELYSERLSG